MYGSVAIFPYKKTCMCINPSPESSSDPFALGIAFMDESHQMLHKKLDQLSLVSDADFSAAFEVLLKQVHNHFKEEEQAMEEIAFPGIACHRDQHAQALNALQHANLRIKEGAVAEGREICGLFSQWLSFHITTMDRMLASVMQHAEAQEVACAAA
jgi:hemerythrin